MVVLLSLFDSTTCLVLMVAFLCAWLILRWQVKPQPCPLPPGPPYPLPVIGHLHLLSKDPRKQFREWRQEYGDIFSFRLGGRVMVIISSYKLIKEAFVKHGDFFSHRPDMYILDEISKKQGVVMSSGETWREQRKVALDILRELGLGKNTLAVKIQEEAVECMKELEKHNGLAFDPSGLLHLSISNVICSVVFGKRYEYGDHIFLKYIKAFESNLRDLGGEAGIVNFIPSLRFLPGDFFHVKRVLRNADMVREYLKDIYVEHVKDYDETSTTDFISAYIREMKRKEASGSATTLSEENLVHMIGDLFVAGTETTSKTLCWSLVYFLHYPQVQEKCFQEIQDKVGVGRSPTLHDKLELPYLEATIMEVQRIINIGPFAIHHSVPEDFVFHGHYIPKNAVVIPLMESVLLEEEIWGDPNNFRPERFLDEAGKCTRPAEFIPFLLGRRVCLGESMAKMEFFLFLSAMIQRFVFLPPEDGTLPSLEGILGMTVAPKPFRVRAVPRN